MNETNLYDFNDLTGVPAELADAVQKERTGKDQELLRSIASAVSGAPIALGIKQVMVVLSKMGVELKSEATIRKYLNDLVASGEIGKPSKQSYWTAESHVASAEGDDAEPVAAPEENAEAAPEGNEDPLAGI